MPVTKNPDAEPGVPRGKGKRFELAEIGAGAGDEEEVAHRCSRPAHKAHGA